MTTTTRHPRSTSAATTNPQRAGIVFSAATGVGVGVGMAVTFLLIATTGLPVGIAMVIGLPAAMVLSIVAALLVVRRPSPPHRRSGR
jgi:hypothetical protein